MVWYSISGYALALKSTSQANLHSFFSRLLTDWRLPESLVTLWDQNFYRIKTSLLTSSACKIRSTTYKVYSLIDCSQKFGYLCSVRRFVNVQRKRESERLRRIRWTPWATRRAFAVKTRAHLPSDTNINVSNGWCLRWKGLGMYIVCDTSMNQRRLHGQRRALHWQMDDAAK